MLYLGQKWRISLALSLTEPSLARKRNIEGLHTMKMIIDTDPGIDDAMAIFWAHASPDIELIGLTSIFGNVYVSQATRNALALVEMLGADIPVAGGADVPVAMPPLPPSHYVHGDEGFGDMPAPTPVRAADPRGAVDFMADACAADPGAVTIMAIGPLTNLAQALIDRPDMVANVGRIVIMGGSVRAGGNVTAFAEANIWHDPHAAAAVFAADWPVEMIGLDVTSMILCDGDDFAAIAANSPICGGFLNRIGQFYLKFYESVSGVHACRLHDPAAVIAAVLPDLFTWEEAPLTVVIDGERMGETFVGGNGRAIRWAANVDAGAVCQLWVNGVSALH
jgi:inosine-uridine nucleoside N-ribohydrolase